MYGDRSSQVYLDHLIHLDISKTLTHCSGPKVGLPSSVCAAQIISYMPRWVTFLNSPEKKSVVACVYAEKLGNMQRQL